jgi:hypothetical protein
MKSSGAYLKKLNKTLSGVMSKLSDKGVEERHLKFGGEGEPPEKKIRVPTDARSEFLANRAMGDWAERSLTDAFLRSFPEWRISQYGNTDSIAAGDPRFKEFYLSGVEETRKFGKRPDLLIFPKEAKVNDDISQFSHTETESLVAQSVCAVEVRSSKFEALKYMKFREQQREQGDSSGRDCPSFTVKVEDLVIVYRWIQRYGIPQSYCQVFFDSIYAINFLDIFSIISNASRLAIDKPDKSQQKATIMIPITEGKQIGRALELPTFSAEHRITQLGRHDAFVVPKGGGFELEPTATKSVLLPDL